VSFIAYHFLLVRYLTKNNLPGFMASLLACFSAINLGSAEEGIKKHCGTGTHAAFLLVFLQIH
jgi:hypothetical protein